ncbi:sorting nexin-7 [Cynoglossus semilaevis]|uniref:Sorting nexin 7 n=1 Tax=Cynoglossus semilaevis TaxID=244447 RepID=A0A3P8VEG9_CYNSE|nr:sorting nexin-7 [Cynoglossus semilaevis]
MDINGQTLPADFSGHMLDMDEDEDLEVFSKKTSHVDGDGNPVPNSPSSMVNQYRLEEDGDEEHRDIHTKDLYITVDDPESHVTAIETFIMYRVLTRTTRSEFDSSEYEVHRRYQDFVWLRSKLEENHPTLIVHPLPEKFVVKGMVERFSNDFIETRRKALDRFLKKTANHPVLSFSPHLQVFLTEADLASHKKQGPGFLSRMGETVRAVANTVRGLKSRPEEFTQMQEYLEVFSSKITSADKVTQRIIREQKEYLDELKQYHPMYVQWANSEDVLADSLKSVADCVERCSKETEEQTQHLSEILCPAIHEYVLCADTLKGVMKRRDNIQAEFAAKNEVLASRKAEKEALQEEVDAHADRLEQANNVLKEDWPRWKSDIRTDLRSALISTAEKNMEYYEKCLAVWESFLFSQRPEPREQSDGDHVF